MSRTSRRGRDRAVREGRDLFAHQYRPHRYLRVSGYSASTGQSAPVTKEAVAAKLATFTDDELLAMGLARKPQKGGKK